MMEQNNDVLAYSYTQTAAKLGICRQSVMKAVKDGKLPSIRIGNRVLVPRVPLEKLLS